MKRRLEILPRHFYDRPVRVVAQDLLGKMLWRETEQGVTAGRIVEVEAYHGSDDPASHSYRGQTKRNASMFGPPGHAYVYTIHAKFCMNVVTEAAGTANAVLLRAVEPIHGCELMRARRLTDVTLDLTRGPARLCQAFQIDRQMDGWDLTLGEQLWLTEGEGKVKPNEIAVTPRIGVTSAKDWLMRYIIAGNRYVSGPARLRQGLALPDVPVNEGIANAGQY